MRSWVAVGWPRQGRKRQGELAKPLITSAQARGAVSSQRRLSRWLAPGKTVLVIPGVAFRSNEGGVVDGGVGAGEKKHRCCSFDVPCELHGTRPAVIRKVRCFRLPRVSFLTSRVSPTSARGFRSIKKRTKSS